MINKERIRVQVAKAISKVPSIVEIKRNTTNDYGEPSGEEDVATVTGFFYTGSQTLNINITTGASVTTGKSEKFLVVYDTEGQKIKENDYFTLNGIKYKVIDLGNLFDICLDMTLERV